MGQFIISVNSLQHNSGIEEQINITATKIHHPCTIQSKSTPLKTHWIHSTLRVQGFEKPNTRTAEAMNVKNLSLQ
jgi:hypothetical protein